MYAPWEEPHDSVERPRIYADASVHRVISDLSVFIGQADSHRIIAAGDLNILHGYGERGSEFWASRYATPCLTDSRHSVFASSVLNFPTVVKLIRGRMNCLVKVKTS